MRSGNPAQTARSMDRARAVRRLHAMTIAITALLFKRRDV